MYYKFYESARKNFVQQYMFFYSDNSEKYQESRKNRGEMVIISSELGIFRSQNTKDPKNDMKLYYRLQ